MTEYLQSFMPILSSELGHLGDELNGYVHILIKEIYSLNLFPKLYIVITSLQATITHKK